MLYVFDSDIFSLYMHDDANVLRQVINHAAADLCLSIVTVEEAWTGWWTAIRQAKTQSVAAAGYEQLTETVVELRNWQIISFSEPAMRRHSGLKLQKLNVRTNDLKIAAISLEIGATVVTRNTRDFARVSGLTLEDWSK